ncbi:MAG TPA: CaiB/BaiF CoA-transferase family protein [Bryobacteraceae bacterium]|jgi:crotonobetainyl-CoA:carnitine CoA-transferase CaiB-like acyl-CoA transferase|nr:CaiB/BaiF CoA-transferase family protein [Bryobacteraceae bacterium]
MLPFSGLRVVAVEQAVTAPFCTRQLADLGADVVKIERPDGGDFARDYDHVLHGISAYFAWLNRGKRSVALDLKQPAGREALGRLIERADVFVHNLAPGAIERLGFAYEETAARNPRLIWCGISGYGPDGPYRDRKAYDMLVQGEAGIIGLTGTEEAPAKVGISMADIASGLHAYASILAALYARVRTGRGERIDISMLECLAEWTMPPIYTWLGAGRVPARCGARHNMIVPYGVYACADGPVNFSIQNEREWVRFCEGVLGRPELAVQYPSNEARLAQRREVEAEIEACFGRETRAEILRRLDAAGIANGAVNSVPEVAQHPQLAARGRWTEADSPAGPIPALLPPHNLAGAPPRMGRVPALGEHTEEVLKELE